MGSGSIDSELLRSPIPAFNRWLYQSLQFSLNALLVLVISQYQALSVASLIALTLSSGIWCLNSCWYAFRRS